MKTLTLDEARATLERAEDLRAEAATPDALARVEAELAYAEFHLGRLEAEEAERQRQAARKEAERITRTLDRRRQRLADAHRMLIAAVTEATERVAAYDEAEREYRQVGPEARTHWQRAGLSPDEAKQRTGYWDATPFVPVNLEPLLHFLRKVARA